MAVGVSLVPVVLYLRYAREMMTGIVSTSSIIFRVRTRDDDNIRGSLVVLYNAGYFQNSWLSTSPAIEHSAVHEMKKAVVRK